MNAKDDLPEYLNGKPYYCNTCGLWLGEYYACEELDCELESEEEAQARRQRYLENQG